MTALTTDHCYSMLADYVDAWAQANDYTVTSDLRNKKEEIVIRSNGDDPRIQAIVFIDHIGRIEDIRIIFGNHTTPFNPPRWLYLMCDDLCVISDATERDHHFTPKCFMEDCANTLLNHADETKQSATCTVCFIRRLRFQYARLIGPLWLLCGNSAGFLEDIVRLIGRHLIAVGLR